MRLHAAAEGATAGRAALGVPVAHAVAAGQVAHVASRAEEDMTEWVDRAEVAGMIVQDAVVLMTGADRKVNQFARDIPERGELGNERAGSTSFGFGV